MRRGRGGPPPPPVPIGRARKASGRAEYLARPGASGIDDRDARVITKALVDIATRNKVDDVRSLDKHLVFAEVEADPRHPLRRFYDWNVEAAARKHWLARTQELINGIRIVNLNINGERGVPKPVFVYVAPSKQPRNGGGRYQRSHVFTPDALAKDPVFMSMISQQVRAVKQAAQRLFLLTSERKPPPWIAQLCVTLRHAVDQIDEAGRSDQAAE